MNKVPFKLFELSAIPQFDYIIFVYDLSRTSTWHDVKKYKEEIEKYMEKDSLTKCFIIGNKVDKENLMNINTVTFFAPHIEITANSETPYEKEVCKYIWENAILFN
jgi:CO dehydrogenase nickel-insertion accessory protein CooC1